MTFRTTEDRLKYLESLLTEEDWRKLLHLKDEWYDCGEYESDAEIIEEHFNICIPHKGYDLLYQKFYCVALYVFQMPEYSVTLNKFISFDNLKDYIAFFNNDIYDNASYFGYEFSELDINTYHIDTQKINVEPFYSRTYHNDRSIENVKSMISLRWQRAERQKTKLLSLCKDFLNYASYDEMLRHHSDMNDGDFLFAAQYSATRNPEKTYAILDTYCGSLGYDLENYAQYYFKDPDIYNKYTRRSIWLSPFQLMDCIEDKSITKETTFEIDTQIGFDKETNMFYKQYQAHYDNHIGLMFKEWFLNVEEMASALNNDLSNADFSGCFYDIDWTQYNVQNSQIPKGNIKRVIHVQLINNKFECVMKYVQGNAELTSNSHSFLCARDVIHYLDYDNDKNKICQFRNAILNSEEYIVCID